VVVFFMLYRINLKTDQSGSKQKPDQSKNGSKQKPVGRQKLSINIS
jgi:hypothetical protein